MMTSTRSELWIVAMLALLLWRPSKASTKRLSLAELRDLARSVGFAENSDHAASIAMRESGGDPRALNDTRGKAHPPGIIDELSIGLWQINVLAHPQWSVEWLKDPKHNATAAFELFQANGWKPWKLTAGE